MVAFTRKDAKMLTDKMKQREQDEIDKQLEVTPGLGVEFEVEPPKPKIQKDIIIDLEKNAIPVNVINESQVPKENIIIEPVKQDVTTEVNTIEKPLTDDYYNTQYGIETFKKFY